MTRSLILREVTGRPGLGSPTSTVLEPGVPGFSGYPHVTPVLTHMHNRSFFLRNFFLCFSFPYWATSIETYNFKEKHVLSTNILFTYSLSSTGQTFSLFLPQPQKFGANRIAKYSLSHHREKCTLPASWSKLGLFILSLRKWHIVAKSCKQ